MEIVKYIVTFLAGMGAGWTLKVVITNRVSRTARTSVVSQKNNEVKGDMVAGDMYKNTEPKKPRR